MGIPVWEWPRGGPGQRAIGGGQLSGARKHLLLPLGSRVAPLSCSGRRWEAGLFDKLRDLSSGVSAVQNACGAQALPSAALGVGREKPKPGGPAALVWVRSGALCCEHPTQLRPALGLLSAWPSPEPPVSLREQKAGAPPPTRRCVSSREDDKAPGSATLELGAHLSPCLCDQGLQPGSRLQEHLNVKLQPRPGMCA